MGINRKLNPFDFGKNPIRQSTFQLKAVPLEKGYYYDTGYRFRKNLFIKYDNRLSLFRKNSFEFFDMKMFNYDQVNKESPDEVDMIVK